MAGWDGRGGGLAHLVEELPEHALHLLRHVHGRRRLARAHRGVVDASDRHQAAHTHARREIRQKWRQRAWALRLLAG
jgi:hypothetical protein